MKDIDTLIRNLESNDAKRRYEACEELRLADSIPQRAIEALQNALKDSHDEVVVAARRALVAHDPAGGSQSGAAFAPSGNVDTTTQVIQMPSSPPNSPEYVFALEMRIKYLESEIAQLRKLAANGDSLARSISAKVPKTDIISQNFLTRAFAIWGHQFVAQFLISVPLYCIFYLLTSSGR